MKKNEFIVNWVKLIAKKSTNEDTSSELKKYNEFANNLNMSTLLKWKKEAINSALNNDLDKYESNKEAKIKFTANCYRFFNYQKKIKDIASKYKCKVDFNIKNKLISQEIKCEIKCKNQDAGFLIKELKLLEIPC